MAEYFTTTRTIGGAHAAGTTFVSAAETLDATSAAASSSSSLSSPANGWESASDRALFGLCITVLILVYIGLKYAMYKLALSTASAAAAESSTGVPASGDASADAHNDAQAQASALEPLFPTLEFAQYLYGISSDLLSWARAGMEKLQRTRTRATRKRRDTETKLRPLAFRRSSPASSLGSYWMVGGHEQVEPALPGSFSENPKRRYQSRLRPAALTGFRSNMAGGGYRKLASIAEVTSSPTSSSRATSGSPLSAPGSGSASASASMRPSHSARNRLAKSPLTSRSAASGPGRGVGVIHSPMLLAVEEGLSSADIVKSPISPTFTHAASRSVRRVGTSASAALLIVKSPRRAAFAKAAGAKSPIARSSSSSSSSAIAKVGGSTPRIALTTITTKPLKTQDERDEGFESDRGGEDEVGSGMEGEADESTQLLSLR